MKTEAEDFAEACKLLVFQRQNELIITASNIQATVEDIEQAFNDYKRAVFRFREYEALAKQHSELG